MRAPTPEPATVAAAAPPLGAAAEDTLDLRLADELVALFRETSDPPTAGRPDSGADGDLLDSLADWGARHHPARAPSGSSPYALDRDLALITRWMNDPAVAAFWELAGPETVTAAHLRAQLDGDGRSVPCLGVLDGVPMSYWEIYRADLDPLARHYPARPHDTGIHLLIGGVADRGRGLGTTLLRAVADLVLDHRPRCARVIAEPDLRNIPSVVRLPERRLPLLRRSRPARQASRAHGPRPRPAQPAADTTPLAATITPLRPRHRFHRRGVPDARRVPCHPRLRDEPAVRPASRPPGLDPDRLATGPPRRLLAKMLGEFAYEEIIEPESEPESGPERSTGSGAARRRRSRRPGRVPAVPAPRARRYALSRRRHSSRFRARRGAYGSWRVDPCTPSTRRPALHRPVRLPRPRPDRLLGLDGATLGHLVRELTATLSADARLDHTRADRRATSPTSATPNSKATRPATPGSSLNKGRIGFSASDAARWAPEARSAGPAALDRGQPRPRRLPRRPRPRRTRTTSTPANSTRAVRESFPPRCARAASTPRTTSSCPCTPGSGTRSSLPALRPRHRRGRHRPAALRRRPAAAAAVHPHLPQHRPRPTGTPSNCRCPILNTLVWRGLPTERTLAAPAVTAWVHGLRDADPFLRDECRRDPARRGRLGHRRAPPLRPASRGARTSTRSSSARSGASRWSRRLAPGERARTLASLLHTDPHGRSFTAELVARSGLAPAVWLRRLFAALLPPLLHFLYRYGTVFSPHGENAIVVFDEQDVRCAWRSRTSSTTSTSAPSRCPSTTSMPEEVREVLLTEEPAFLTQFIHSGLFVGVFRYLAPLCEEQLGRPGGRVLVARTGGDPAPPGPLPRAQGPLRDVRPAHAAHRAPLPQPQPSAPGRLPRPPRPPARRRARHRPQPAAPAVMTATVIALSVAPRRVVGL